MAYRAVDFEDVPRRRKEIQKGINAMRKKQQELDGQKTEQQKNLQRYINSLAQRKAK